MTAVWAIMMSTIRGRKDVTFRGKLIPGHRLRLAVSNLFFYVITLIIGIYLLMLTETGAIYPIIFEATSALGTVGLSMGITSDLSVLGKLIIIVLMFFGRIGPLTLGISLLGRSDEDSKNQTSEVEDLAI